jgi:hypothetical protein
MKPLEPESCICCSLFVLHQVGGFAQSCQRGSSTGLVCVHASTNEHADHRALLCTPLPRNTSVAGDGTKVAAAEEGDAFQHRGACVFIQLPSVVQGLAPRSCGCFGAGLQTCILRGIKEGRAQGRSRRATDEATSLPQRARCKQLRDARQKRHGGQAPSTARKGVWAKLVAKFSCRFGAAPGDSTEACGKECLWCSTKICPRSLGTRVDGGPGREEYQSAPRKVQDTDPLAFPARCGSN